MSVSCRACCVKAATRTRWAAGVLTGLMYVCISAIEPAAGAPDSVIYFQAHRGGLEEVPENTLAALTYAWAIPGAVPELDIRTTQDGVPVCIHDETPARTTAAPAEWANKNIRDIPLATLQTWDAGSHFAPHYSGERVPTLAAVLDLLAAVPSRQLYLDLKDVDNRQIIAMLTTREVTEQIIFVHGSPAACLELSQSWSGARTMTWLSGSPERIKTRFRELATTNFAGISQIQLHLQPEEAGVAGRYALGDAFLEEAVTAARSAGVTLQARPFVFDTPSFRALIDRGIHWYVADAPKKMRAAIVAAAGE